jgi:hypothetical protein
MKDHFEKGVPISFLTFLTAFKQLVRNLPLSLDDMLRSSN